ncbi:uroporphyrinogen-III synthase [Dinghuibacter silviterrae]|uniref:Uroporphyrinogen-III synthase n=1 Tax=Dinghuibacter silviterrae TaxID=1539049 RepID=A0A4R8DES5_9BACT|nr:uroporphyrinogen-III synthase [Dinghuibacter silviterrae]TDW95734.1 uroporphyrinogen-III synthase [Dinghuibacter silviterrae]
MGATHSILSTKILDDRARSFARSRGWSLREEEFITTRPLPWDPPPMDTRTVAIFTSAAGVVRLGDPAAVMPPGGAAPAVACLSGKTLDTVVKRLPSAKLVCTAANSAALAHALVADGRFTKAVFFCARAHRPELPQILQKAGIDVTEVPVYETTGVSITIDTPYDAVLFFSPSGVDSFFQANRLHTGVACFAIGETTAISIKNHTDTRIVVSEAPTQEALLTCVRSYFDHQQCYE